MPSMANKEMVQVDPRMFTPFTETMEDGVTLINGTGSFVIYNSKMTEIAGYSSAEAGTFINLLAMLYKGSVEYRKAMMNVWEIYQRNCRDRETVVRAKDGTLKTLLVSTSILEYQDEKFYLSAYRDITFLKQAEKKILTAEKRYRVLFEQSFDAILIIDPDTSLPIDFNERALDLWGYSEKELLHVALDVFDVDEIFGGEKTLDKMTLAGTGHDFEAKVFAKNGEIKNVMVSVRDIEISGNRLLQCIFHDIGESTRAKIQTGKVFVKPQTKPGKSKTLDGLPFICCICKKVHDDNGSWCQIEAYISERWDALFSHGLCPACAKKNYSNYSPENEPEGE